MNSKLTTRYIQDVNWFPEKMIRHWDTEIKGFMLQVTPKGTMTFYYRYSINGKKKTFKIGNYPDISATQARSIAKAKAGEVAKGIDIQQVKKEEKRQAQIEKKLTLGGFMDNVYRDYLLTELKSGEHVAKNIKRYFGQWYDKPLLDVNNFLVGNWRKQKLKDGLSPGGVNRPIANLRSLLNYAYRQAGVINRNPLGTFKQLKEDSSKIIRYLSEDEEKRLKQAMIDRDNKTRLERVSANQWRKERDYPLLSEVPINGFSDHLTPMVLLALNTGMRRGELFNLQWQDIDFKSKTLAIHGSNAKSGKTLITPLNNEAFATLIKWRNQSDNHTYVFTGKNGNKLTDIKTSFNNLLKSAGIKYFRFHDTRHHFASRLVMEGVDLNTVRELLGHSDLQMTMRYAHLAPSHKSDAVNKLNR